MVIVMHILKIALLQMVSLRRNLDANFRKGETFCRRAAAAGAHVALFPEMWSIGYDGFEADKPATRLHDLFRPGIPRSGANVHAEWRKSILTPNACELAAHEPEPETYGAISQFKIIRVQLQPRRSL
jgi:predicted amidohydrolase